MIDYAEQSESAHFSWWCEEYLRHSVDVFAGQPIIWEQWQRTFWDELLAWDDARQAPYWGSAALVVARKDGKTQMLAALALYRLLMSEDQSEILLAAGTDKQAGRLFDGVIAYLRRAPELNAQVRRREHVGEIVNIQTGGKIVRLTSVGEANDGYNPSLVIADELHGWLTPIRKRLWTSLRTARGARQDFQMVTITTAGEASTRPSGILGRMLDGNESTGIIERPNDGLTISRNHDSRLLIYNYSAPTTDPSDYQAMKLANPASWVTESFIQEQAAADDLTDAEVLQLHGCVWAETDTTYLGVDALRLAGVDFDPITPGTQVVLGFDGSGRNDETWLVAVALDGRIMPLARWHKPQHADQDWRVPRQDVHDQVELAFSRYSVLEFAADPPGWYAEIDVWTEKYGDVVVTFDTNQPKRMAPAVERMRSAINDGEAKYGGDLGGVLREHFGNCVTRETSSGIVVGKDDKMSPRKVDGAVAAIIGYDRAMWHAANVAPTYRTAGFVSAESDRWLDVLSRQLADRQPRLARFDNYYKGEHPLPFLTKAHQAKMMNEFVKMLQDSQANFMRLVVDVVEERLKVEGFRLSASSTDLADKATWDIWQANQLDSEAQVAFIESMVKGVSYLSVWKDPDKRDKPPTVYVEDAAECIVAYTPGSNYRLRSAALKMWRDDEGSVMRANVYLPDSIVKYRSKIGPAERPMIADPRALESSASKTRWEQIPGGTVINPTGIVPIVPLRNRPRLQVEGESELSDVYRIQNQINGQLFLLALAGYMGAHKQRWATGLKIMEDTAKNPVEPFNPAIDRIWQAEDPSVKFGEFGQTDLAGYLASIEQKVEHIAVTTRTPKHYLLPSGQEPSGDAIKSAESGLVKKVLRKQTIFGEGLEEAMRLARKFDGQADSPPDSEIVWADPALRSEAEITDAVIKRWQLNLIDHAQALEDLGYTQTQIARILSVLPDETAPAPEPAIPPAGDNPDNGAPAPVLQGG